jgi:hypothetical protein
MCTYIFLFIFDKYVHTHFIFFIEKYTNRYEYMYATSLSHQHCNARNTFFLEHKKALEHWTVYSKSYIMISTFFAYALFFACYFLHFFVACAFLEHRKALQHWTVYSKSYIMINTLK